MDLQKGWCVLRVIIDSKMTFFFLSGRFTWPLVWSIWIFFVDFLGGSFKNKFIMLHCKCILHIKMIELDRDAVRRLPPWRVWPLPDYEARCLLIGFDVLVHTSTVASALFVRKILYGRIDCVLCRGSFSVIDVYHDVLAQTLSSGIFVLTLLTGLFCFYFC
jgi:hypothetical protein